MKYTKELHDFWKAHGQGNGWKFVTLNDMQESISTVLDEIDRLAAYAGRLLADDKRIWHCGNCGHNWMGRALAEGNALCPECESPMRPQSEIRQDEIDRLRAELEKHRWIPVSTRLPEEDGNYLVRMVYDSPEDPRGYEDPMEVAYFQRSSEFLWYIAGWYENGVRTDEFDVTHWAFLPEPPKEDA